MYYLCGIKIGDEMVSTGISTYLRHVVRCFLSLKSMDNKIINGNILNKMALVGLVRQDELVNVA